MIDVTHRSDEDLADLIGDLKRDLATVREALTQARQLNWTFRNGETRSVLMEQEADEFWDSLIGVDEVLDSIAAELEEARSAYETQREYADEQYRKALAAEAELERVKAERDEAEATGKAIALNMARKADKALSALREIAPEDEPWDIDQDCKFCRGHYGQHYPECAWKNARTAIAEIEGEAPADIPHAYVRVPGTGMNFCGVRGCKRTIAEHDGWVEGEA